MYLEQRHYIENRIEDQKQQIEKLKKFDQLLSFGVIFSSVNFLTGTINLLSNPGDSSNGIVAIASGLFAEVITAACATSITTEKNLLQSRIEYLEDKLKLDEIAKQKTL